MATRSVTVILILALAGIYAHVLASPPEFSVQLPEFSRIPRTIEGWTAQDLFVPDEVARVLDADETLNRVYVDSQGRSVSLFLAYFASQQVNSQIHSPRNCVPGSGWNILSMDKVEQPVFGKDHSATRLIMGRNDARHQMLYWFRTRNGDLTGEYSLKWDLVKNALARKRTDAVFVRLIVPAGQDAALQEFMAALRDPLEDALGRAGL